MSGCADEADVVLGDELNVVLVGLRGGQPHCPKCGVSGPMRVFERGVRWACGNSMPLPLLPKDRPKTAEKRRAHKGARGHRAAA